VNLGQQTKSKAMQDILCYQILKGIISSAIAIPSKQNSQSIIVHHYTDKPEGLQLEYELRLTDGTCKFGRYFVKSV
jgi:hypothetical protein